MTKLEFFVGIFILIIFFSVRLIPVEIESETEAVAASIAEWKRKKENGEFEKSGEMDEVEHLYAMPPEMSAEDRMEEAMMEGKEQR